MLKATGDSSNELAPCCREWGLFPRPVVRC